MKDQKGQILLVVFSLLLLVSVLVSGTSFMWQTGVNTASWERDALRAFYIAQAGLERGRAEIAYYMDDNYNATFNNQSLGSVGNISGSYDLVISVVNASTKEIVSTGRFGNSTRQIFTRVGVDGGGGPPYGVAWGFNAKRGDTWKEQ